MKQNLLLAFVSIFIFSFGFSQNQREILKIQQKTNLSFLKSFASERSAEFKQNKALAYQLAEANNWPKVISEGKQFSELVGVTEDLKPIYYATFNAGAGVTSRANTMYSGGSLGLSIHGEGMTSGIWDGGSAMPSHEIFGGRLTLMDGAPSTSFHAAHVAGTVIGGENVEGGLAKGMAYMADGHSYDWFDDHAEIATAAANGLILSNHSYGINPIFISPEEWGKYNQTSQTIDQIMYNAPYYQFVSAAGNSRGNFNTGKNGYDLIHGHASSKNGITVAAVNQVNDYTGPADVVMSSFSSWGPTDDGRIKPDISAKGVNTYSALDDSTTSYGTLSGTSMAAPSVNGTLLLLQQYYNELNSDFMRSATLRALMAHTADEAGTADGPDYRFGWGLINAERAAEVITNNELSSIIAENVLQNNETYTLSLSPQTDQPIVVTLSWTDPEGALSNSIIDDPTPVLVNDLDLRLIDSSGEVVFPWKLNPATPAAAATKGDNTVDNIEKIEILNPIGSYTLEISHKGTLLNNQQAYSLIVSGITPNDFWVSAETNAFEICEGVSTLTETLDMNFATSFTGDVSLSLLNAPAGINHNFSPSSFTASGQFDLEFTNLDQLDAGVYPMTVRASNSDEDYDFEIGLSVLTDIFSPVMLTSPQNNANSIVQPITFEWEEDSNVNNYSFELALDEDFLDVVQQIDTPSNSVVNTDLDFSTTYYWRVKPNNQCGIGSFSETFQFTTSCETPSNIEFIQVDSSSILFNMDDLSPSIEVEVVVQGTTPTGSGTLYDAPYEIINLSSNTCFDVYVRNTCGTGFSDWVGPFEVCTTPDYCAGDNFYDTGGPDANYQNNENYTETIFPDEDGDRVRAVFNSFNTEGCCDFLRVYNGPTIDSPLLITLNGNLSPDDISSTHPTGALTFWFTSDGSITRQGWDVDIWCEPMPACPSPPTNFFLSAITGSSLTIGWTENNDAVSWEVELVQQGSSPTGNGTVVTENPYMFTDLQPETAYRLYVRSICEDGFSDWASSDFFESGCSAIMAPYTHSAEEQEHMGDIGFCWSSQSNTSNYIWTTFVSYNSNTQTGPNQARTGNKFFATNPYQNASTGNETILFTPTIDLSNLTTPGLEFFTFRNGTNIGSLHVDIIDENGLTEDALVLTGNFQTSAFDDWEKHIIDLSEYTGDVKARFRAVSGGNGLNEIDIDDISFKDLPECPISPTNLEYTFTSSTIDITWTDSSDATSWEVEFLPAGTSPTGQGETITANPIVYDGLTSDTCFDFYIRSICSEGLTDWVGPFEVCTSPDYCTGDNFYDTGGPDANYQNNENYTETIFPDEDNHHIRATFNSFSTENCCDFLRVYNGPSTDSPLITTLNGNINPDDIVSTHPTGALTFWFTSDGSITRPGWDVSIICEPTPACSFPSSNLYLDANATSSITIGWTDSSDATTWEVELVFAGTPPTGSGDIVSTNLATFNDLASDFCYDFYIRSICSEGLSEWVGPFEACTLPDYCGENNFYDTGGPDGNYQNNENWTQTIYPDADDHRVRAVFNSFNVESGWDYLRVYDGPSTSSPLIISLTGVLNPDDIISTHPTGSLTFWFTSDSSITRPGWDIEIICEPFLSVNNSEFQSAIVFYPNPVDEILYINAHQQIEKFQLFDLKGRLLQNRKVNNEQFEVDMSNYEAGLYLIKLMNNNKTAVLKVEKK